MKCRFISIFLLGILSCNVCLATMNTTQISRYMSVKNQAQSEQINLMSQIIQVRFPQNIQTIESAVNYLLKFSGYTLVDNKNIDPALRIVLSKPLPIVDRILGPLSLRDGLSILVGKEFILINDPINREINFKLKPEYRKYLK